MPNDVPIHRIDITEFHEGGYLQEANRRFFHPLGLALEVVLFHLDDVEGCVKDLTREQRHFIYSNNADVQVLSAKIGENFQGNGDREELTALEEQFRDRVFEIAKASGYFEPRLGGVWDYRDDPEGIYFAGVDLRQNYSKIEAEWREKAETRNAALGYVYQPPLDGTDG